MPFYYNLVFDSSVWYPSKASGTMAWTPTSPDFGWHGDTEIESGYVSYSSTTETISGGIGRLGNCTRTNYFNFVYHDPIGVSHSFPNSTVFSTGGSCGNPTTSAIGTDQFGLTLSVTSYTHCQIKETNGTLINVPTIANGSASITDSNGNVITADGQGHFIDTTGKTVLTVSGTPPNSKVIAYTGFTGANQGVQMLYTSYTVRTNFGCSGVADYPPTQNYLVSQIVMPDGSSYHFTYEETPGYAGNVTGRIASVQLPQGGVIEYSYSGSNGGIDCADGSAIGLTRTIQSAGGSPGSTWSYSRAITSSGSSSTEITDGNNNTRSVTFVNVDTETAPITAYEFETSASRE